MTTGKRGFRAISVDGRRLLWRVLPEGCPCGLSHSVVLVDASREGSVVRLSGPLWTGADGEIVPRLIADGARKALALGWLPGQGSGLFTHLGEHASAHGTAPTSRASRALR